LILDVRKVVAIRMQIFVAREDPLFADRCLELSDRRRELIVVDAGG